MDKELAKAYDAKKYEEAVYEGWEKGGDFKAKVNGKKEPYTIMLPPPNATGTLHLGHAVMLAIEDILTRFWRMRGREALWLPGTDHASIATQNKVEKLLEEEGKTRHSLGRKRFLKRVDKFVAGSQGTIRKQMRKMGASCDWSRESYTLDEKLVTAVVEQFVRMYEDGLIYRGDRIVNWCVRCGSTLADDEVENKERDAKLYYIKYGPFVIATSRPETKLADTGMAVNPKDKRYKDYIGKEYEIDLAGHKIKVKVVGDRGIDPEFGTGALGVTPGHSQVDYEMAMKNDLEVIKLINEEGRITEAGGKYEGLTAEEAREQFVADLRAEGLIERVEDYKQPLAVCYRCGAAVEPLPSEQWFIDVNKKIKKDSPTPRGRTGGLTVEGKSLKELMAEVVRERKIEIIPERFEKIYFHWIENLRDWCVSRQIWFGHRVPAWWREKEEAPDKVKQVPAKGEVYGPESKEERFVLMEKDWEYLEEEGVKWEEEKTEVFWDYYDGKERRRVQKDGKEKVEEYGVNCVGVTGRRVSEVEVGGKKAWVEFRWLENGFCRFEIEFEGKASVHFKGRRRVQGWEILGKMTGEVRERLVYVGRGEPKGEGWEQDKDTLDTWFSSGLWTFSTLGWPEKTKDLDFFHPTSCLNTGYDILFFWVARMILMTTYSLGEVPFEKVYLHGLVRTRDGAKMSKSKPETCIDPLDMIGKYGADAVRLSLVVGTTPGNDVKLYEEKIQGFRNFVNKIWNIVRFALMRVEDRRAEEKVKVEEFGLAEKWIMSRMQDVIGRSTERLENYEIGSVGQEVYDFLWHEFADWYLEVSKQRMNEGVVMYVVKEALKLLHPFAPFVTEVLWGEMGEKGKLIKTAWPEVREEFMFPEEEKDFEMVQGVVTEIRNLRTEAKVSPKKEVRVVLHAGDGMGVMRENEEVIMSLAGVEELEIMERGEKVEGAMMGVAGGVAVYMLLEGLVDKEEERGKVEKEMEEVERYLMGLEKKLGNERFLAGAPEEVVRAEREKHKEARERLEKLRERREALS